MKRALDILEKSLGKEHPQVATALNNLARLYQATNHLSAAEPLAKRVVEIFLRFTRDTGHPHPHLQAAFANYAGLLQAMGRSEAEIGKALSSLAAKYGLSASGQKP
jgi:4-aminobutyrate aminotransferase-like enzyme